MQNLNFHFFVFYRPGYHTEIPTEDHIHAEDYGWSFGGCWAASALCPVTMRDVVLDFLKDNASVDSSF